ncbi:MAG: ABC transporter permease, partial [Chloroflexota bacterium]
MLRYILQRLFALIPTLLGVSILVFAAIRLVPGDLITAQLGTEAGMLSDAQRASLEAYYGLDKPAFQQYFVWLGNTLRGDMGLSVRQGESVLTLILQRFPVTIQLALMSVVIALGIGVPVGVLAAIRQNTFLDYIGRVFAMLGLAVP